MTTQPSFSSLSLEGDHRSSLYEQDFYQWTQRMAELIRAGHWQEIDVENIAEEIESLGRSDKRELRSRLDILLMHLLKWSYQPDSRTNSWRATITEQRFRILDLLEDSPSLKPFLESEFERCYQNARKLAADETGLPLATFPEGSPFNSARTLESDFLPD
jgi:hypothetical protein